MGASRWRHHLEIERGNPNRTFSGPTQRLTLEKATTHIPRMRLAAERLGRLFQDGSP
jgi:hypothetical protein